MTEQIDRKMDEGVDQRVGDLMNQKIDTTLDDSQDNLWREKGLLVVAYSKKWKERGGFQKLFGLETRISALNHLYLYLYL